jgi:CHAD domain-containing protein
MVTEIEGLLANQLGKVRSIDVLNQTVLNTQLNTGVSKNN